MACWLKKKGLIFFFPLVVLYIIRSYMPQSIKIIHQYHALQFVEIYIPPMYVCMFVYMYVYPSVNAWGKNREDTSTNGICGMLFLTWLLSSSLWTWKYEHQLLPTWFCESKCLWLLKCSNLSYIFKELHPTQPHSKPGRTNFWWLFCFDHTLYYDE